MYRLGTFAGFLAALFVVFGLTASDSHARRESPMHALGEAYQKQYTAIKKLGPNATPEQKERASSEAFQHANEVMGKSMQSRNENRAKVMQNLLDHTGKRVGKVYSVLREKGDRKGWHRFRGDLHKGKGGPKKPKDKTTTTNAAPADSPKATGRTVKQSGQGGATGAEKVDYKKSDEPDDDEPAAPAKAAPEPKAAAPSEQPKKKKRVIVNGVIQEQ